MARWLRFKPWNYYQLVDENDLDPVNTNPFMISHKSTKVEAIR